MDLDKQVQVLLAVEQIGNPGLADRLIHLLQEPLQLVKADELLAVGLGDRRGRLATTDCEVAKEVRGAEIPAVGVEAGELLVGQQDGAAVATRLAW
jgi:hypothetical protein